LQLPTDSSSYKEYGLPITDSGTARRRWLRDRLRSRLCGARHASIPHRTSRVRARMFALGRRDQIGTTPRSIAAHGQEPDGNCPTAWT